MINGDSTVKQMETEPLNLCRVCGTTEPSRFYSCIHHFCKHCFAPVSKQRRMKQATKNKELYGTIYPPGQMEKRREYMRLKRAERRSLALSLLGSRCECCGESRPDNLAFNHIHGNGRKSGGGFISVDHILKMDYPSSEYKILCHNCNNAISVFGYCPHQGRPIEKPVNRTLEPLKNRRQLSKKYRREFVTEFGGKCATCGEDTWEFLTVDHINNGGTEHREKIGKAGVHFYRWLKRQGYPKDDYQLLCFNCNTTKEIARRASKCLF